MAFYHLSLLSENLKIGIFTGAIVVSTASGISSFIVYRKEIYEYFSKDIPQMGKEVFDHVLSPLGRGFNRLMVKYGEWIKVLNKDSVSEYLSGSNLKRGSDGLLNGIEDFSKEVRRFGDSIHQDIKDMDEKTLINYIYKVFDSYDATVNSFSIFLSFFDAILKTVDLELPKFMLPNPNGKTKSPQNPTRTLISSWITFHRNAEIIAVLGREEKQEVVNFITEQPEDFDSKVEQLSKNKSKWGKYKNKKEFLKDLLPPPRWKQMIVNKISSAFFSCQQSKDPSQCLASKVSGEEIEEFLGDYDKQKKDNGQEV